MKRAALVLMLACASAVAGVDQPYNEDAELDLNVSRQLGAYGSGSAKTIAPERDRPSKPLTQLRCSHVQGP